MVSQDELRQELAGLRRELAEQRREIQRLKEGHAQVERDGKEEDVTVDRRQFLKKAGALSVAGIGASLFAKNASAFQIYSSNPLTYRDLNDNMLFEIQTDGTFDLQGNKISNVDSISGDVTGNQEITDIAGNNLSIEDGVLTAAGGNGDTSDIEGVVSKRRNVGALVGGTYHANTFTDGGYGVVFEAADIRIASVVVDADLSGVSDPTLTIELRQFQNGADDPPIVDSRNVSLSGGPERVTLDFDVPPSGATDADPNDEYVLQRGPANNDEIPLRRRFEDEGDWSEADYAEQTFTSPQIDFLRGSLNSPSASGSEPVGSWYYFFDWLVGPEEDRVTSPWSTDVDELYVRDHDPTEETDVSPRALWIDTSDA